MITRIFVSFFILASIGINIMAEDSEKYSIKTGTVIDTLYFETINNLNRQDSVKEYSVLYLEFLKIGPNGEIIDLNSVDDLDDLYYVYSFKVPRIFVSYDSLIAVKYMGKLFMVPDFISGKYIKINDNNIITCEIKDSVYSDIFVNYFRNWTLLEVKNDSVRVVKKDENSYIRMIE